MNRKLFWVMFSNATLIISVIILVISLFVNCEKGVILIHASLAIFLIGAPLEIKSFYIGYLFLLLSRLALYYNMPYLATSLLVMLVILITIVIIRIATKVAIIRKESKKNGDQ